MVCLGNICRSPLAHGVLEHLVKEKNLNWEIDSAVLAKLVSLRLQELTPNR